jgi:hypothetical protein
MVDREAEAEEAEGREAEEAEAEEAEGREAEEAAAEEERFASAPVYFSLARLYLDITEPSSLLVAF